jgi:hypothetical protein
MGRTSGIDEPGYVKGDGVCVLSGHGSREPGVVIGYYVDWDSTWSTSPGEAPER